MAVTFSTDGKSLAREGHDNIVRPGGKYLRTNWEWLSSSTQPTQGPDSYGGQWLLRNLAKVECSNIAMDK